LDAIIVDDERLARKELKGLLAGHAAVRVLGEAASLSEAKLLLRRTAPDVVFLDIQLGHENGFQLLEQVHPACKVVFVTAYDEYAVRAFEVNALDYLLKPVNPERLEATLQRLTAGSTLSPQARPLRYDDRVLIESERRSLLVTVSSIQFIAAAADYSELVVAKLGRLLTGRSLRDWEERLPAGRFLRVHRSTIVNLGCVDRLEPSLSGGYLLYIHGLNAPLAVSRRYATRLREKLC
jgi:two-component system, LytTR family, response regulator